MNALPQTYIFAAVGAVVGVYLVGKLLKIGSRGSGLPPGPSTIPILGNLHQIPLAYSYRQFTQWARDFGPIYSVKAGPQTLIILTGSKEIKEILDRRSATTSDRPASHIANDLITNHRHMLTMPYGPRWRNIRKIAHQFLTANMCEQHHQAIQDAESIQMISDLLDKPTDYYRRVQRYSTAVILSIVYGTRGPTWNGAVEAIYNVMTPWTEILELGATPPIDAFPFLQKLPDALAPWRGKAKKIQKMEADLYGGLVDKAKARIAKGVNRPCLIDNLMALKAKDKEGLLDDCQINYICGVLLEGGSDTTATMILVFMLAACAFPETFAKAQKEVDQAVGRSRMPNFTDYDSLPYIRMCVKECQRWRPVAVMNIPHRTTQDEQYGPYLIPKGSTIIGNTWGMHHDPKRFPDPDVYNPERYKEFPLTAPEYAAMAGNDARDHWGYGNGRRICVGIHVAERSLFLNFARLAWAFDIRQDLSEPVDTANFTPGFLSAPRPFKCILEPRDANTPQVVAHELAEAQPTFERFSD